MDAGSELSQRQGEPSQAGRAAHPIMFWVLTGLAFAVFVPCALVPLWYDGEQLREYERACASTVAALEAQSARNRTRMEALQADPLVVERVMRRELNYQPADERIVHVSAGGFAESPPTLSEPRRPASVDTPPAPVTGWVHALSRWLPNWPWRGLFLETPNRTLFLVMAGALQAAAFLLYASPSRTRRPSS